MIENPQEYGSAQISKATLEKIFNVCSVTDMEKEILLLRFGFNWYIEDIAIHIGEKYRNKAYSEGTIRYKINRALGKLSEEIERYNLK